MCGKAVFWALKQTGLRPVVKLALIYLADAADDSGKCQISFAFLAQRIEVSRRAVMQAINTLETAGLLVRERKIDADGGASGNLYQLNISDKVNSLDLGIARSHPPDWIQRRHSVFIRDDFTCRYCGSRVKNPHGDHVIPRSRGGSNEVDNLVTACPVCNFNKGNRTPQEWRQ